MCIIASFFVSFYLFSSKTDPFVFEKILIFQRVGVKLRCKKIDDKQTVS